MLIVFYALAVVLIAFAAALSGGGWIFFIGLAAFAAHLGWQIARLDIDDATLCLRLFKSNRDAGLFLFAAMLFEAAF
jgi:4-hydroxybenzoate polyprenyltransferase